MHTQKIITGLIYCTLNQKSHPCAVPGLECRPWHVLSCICHPSNIRAWPRAPCTSSSVWGWGVKSCWEIPCLMGVVLVVSRARRWWFTHPIFSPCKIVLQTETTPALSYTCALASSPVAAEEPSASSWQPILFSPIYLCLLPHLNPNSPGCWNISCIQQWQKGHRWVFSYPCVCVLLPLYSLLLCVLCIHSVYIGH